MTLRILFGLLAIIAAFAPPALRAAEIELKAPAVTITEQLPPRFHLVETAELKESKGAFLYFEDDKHEANFFLFVGNPKAFSGGSALHFRLGVSAEVRAWYFKTLPMQLVDESRYSVAAADGTNWGVKGEWLRSGGTGYGYLDRYIHVAAPVSGTADHWATLVMFNGDRPVDLRPAMTSVISAISMKQR